MFTLRCFEGCAGGSDGRKQNLASGICCRIHGTCTFGGRPDGHLVGRGGILARLFRLPQPLRRPARGSLHARRRRAQHCAPRCPRRARGRAADLLLSRSSRSGRVSVIRAAVMGDPLVQLGGSARAAKKPREPKPDWLRLRMPGGGRYEQVKRTLRELNLHTVCEEASCPNVGECWGGGTATVMLMGDVCTRGCRFCDVNSGTPAPLDPLEPRHLAEAVGRLGLDYLVVTSVNRDELPDGGASHFAQAIVELRRAAPRM